MLKDNIVYKKKSNHWQQTFESKKQVMPNSMKAIESKSFIYLFIYLFYFILFATQ